MKKVYRLQIDSVNYAVFYEDNNLEDKFFNKYWEWQHIDLEKYIHVNLKLYKSDSGKVNFGMDIGLIAGGLMILSEKAVNVLKEILDKTGQVVPIVTQSKRKKFYGFYPNKNVYDLSVIDMEKSEYTQAEKGKIFYKLVLNGNNPKNDYLFTLHDEPMKIFVTEKFKQLVEKHELKGFDFSQEIEITQ